jgi:putative transposase
VKRAHKLLLRPTVRQEQAPALMLRDHCSLYNGALQERRDAYRHASRTTVRYGDQSAQLKEIRAFDPECQGRRALRHRGLPEGWGRLPLGLHPQRLPDAGTAASRAVRGRVKTISVKREGHRWFVILACDEVHAEPLPATGSIVGIVMGTVHFFTDSRGAHVENPCFLESMAEELAAAQRHLAMFPKSAKRQTKAHRAALESRSC